MYDLLMLLEENARYNTAELAAMLNKTEAEVSTEMDKYKADGVIKSYTTIIDWDKTERDYVQARIELKVTPKKDRGFDELAMQIAQFDEVQSLYLMSGGYDLALTVNGRSFKEIASFVTFRLAPLDAVQSTTTHFVLRKYKDKGVIIESSDDRDGRVLL